MELQKQLEDKKELHEEKESLAVYFLIFIIFSKYTLINILEESIKNKLI